MSLLLKKMQMFEAAVAGGPVFVTSPLVVTKTSANSTTECHAGFRFQAVGFIDEIGPGSSDQTTVNAGEWHEDEPLATGNDFDIRCASVSVGVWDFPAAAVGTWVRLNLGRNWTVVRTVGKGGEGSGSDQVVSVFEIRDVATETVQTTFTVDATATVPL